MIRRRDFITLLGGAAAAWPLAARAQQQGPMRRVGVLMPGSETDMEEQSRVTAFQQGLAKVGWMNGRNVLVTELSPHRHDLGEPFDRSVPLHNSCRHNRDISAISRASRRLFLASTPRARAN